MIYVNDHFDTRYKFLVDYGSNYLLLSKDSYSIGDSGDPDYLDCTLIYFTPSFSSISFNYPSYQSATFSDVSDNFTTNLYYARDFPIIIGISLLVLFCLCFIINGFTRIVLRGGVLFNK